MPDYNKIVAFFDEYIVHYREFLKFEYSKLDMINKGEIERLSNALSSEQAFIMKTNSYEAKRVKLLDGMEDISFEQLAENAPPEYHDRLSDQHRELSRLVFKIKELNDTANIVISGRLKRIQKKTAELDVYDGRGSLKREHASKAAISKNV